MTPMQGDSLAVMPAQAGIQEMEPVAVVTWIPGSSPGMTKKNHEAAGSLHDGQQAQWDALYWRYIEPGETDLGT
jgi:hypothetical protein